MPRIKFPQHVDHVGGLELPRDAAILPRELVNDRQHFKLRPLDVTSASRSSPTVIPLPADARRVQALAAVPILRFFVLLLQHFQALLPPQSPDSLLIHRPAFQLE